MLAIEAAHMHAQNVNISDCFSTLSHVTHSFVKGGRPPAEQLFQQVQLRRGRATTDQILLILAVEEVL